MLRSLVLLAQAGLGLALLATIPQPLRSEDSPAAAPVHRVLPPSQFPADGRLRPQRMLRDQYHPWTPPQSIAEWEPAREYIRTQLLVACGLWPLPEKTPLEPVIHGKVDREDYTVERVFFASRPGLYCTGSLYRPKSGAEPRPAVLCPHGHWSDGRFYEAPKADAQKQIESGAESRMCGALYPLQARMVQLARMGCVVFHYDMIGYADQGPLDHRTGFSDADAELRSQNIMGLQTWNSLRALDFVAALPDVDPTRIGVTGASGGGTQTFVLCALDPRPAVAFPAVMVSTNMQGGCVCENASWLRTGLNNVAFAACFAPKPLAMSGANDWTIDIESRGLPELTQVWGLYNKSELVKAKCYPQFGHNYNEVSRKLMYGWMNEHLGLGQSEPIEEREFQPLTRAEATVFTAEHPRPEDAAPVERLRPQLTDEQSIWYADLLAHGKQDSAAYRAVVGPATEVMFGPVPTSDGLESVETGRAMLDDALLTRGWCRRQETAEQIPWVLLQPKPDANGTPSITSEVTVWIDGRGKQALFETDGRPGSEVRRLLSKGRAVLAADVFMTGEFLPVDASVGLPTNREFAGYTFGYNRPLIAERVRDILTVAALARRQAGEHPIHLQATGEAGPWMLLARGQLADGVGSTRVEIGDFSFSGLKSTQDANFLPGASKFGGLGGLLGLAGPVAVEVVNCGPAAQRELEPFVSLGGELKLAK